MTKDTYIFEKTIIFPDGVARIFRPVLTEEEKKRRISNIHKATANLFKGDQK
jgi:hypothetical protein